MRIGLLASHPVQYNTPVFRELSKTTQLHVYYGHRQTSFQQAEVGYGVAFDWDVDLLDGHEHSFLDNVASEPGVGRFRDCDTPSILEFIDIAGYDAFVVMGWSLKCYWQAVMACRSRAVPVLVRGDSQLMSPRSVARKAVKRLAQGQLLGYFDGFLSAGQRNKEYLMHYGVSSERIFWAPHSVDVTWFGDKAREARQARSEFRKQMGIAPESVVLLFVGRCLPWKRPFDVVNAAARLRARGVETEVVVVGDGPLRRETARLARGLGVRYHDIGFQNQAALPGYYTSADVLIVPSTGEETWGLVVNEAFACGLPAVVSDAVGCGPDLIQPGETGALFGACDTESLVDSVAQLLPALGGVQMREALASKSAVHSPSETARGILHAVAELSRIDVGSRATRWATLPSPIPMLERLSW